MLPEVARLRTIKNRQRAHVRIGAGGAAVAPQKWEGMKGMAVIWARALGNPGKRRHAGA